LGWLHLDTGAFYRAATLAALRKRVDLSNSDGILKVTVERRYQQDEGRMYLDGEEVTTEIRGPEVTAAVSTVAAVPGVRKFMVRHQREWVSGHRGDAVVEGRDIGTVVFPDADLKVWLVANPRVRAVRRSAETGESLSEVEKDLARRDRADATRIFSPQKPAADAIHLDTSNLSVDRVVNKIVELVDAIRQRDARRKTPDASHT
jgi:cytidylate kinase